MNKKVTFSLVFVLVMVVFISSCVALFLVSEGFSMGNMFLSIATIILTTIVVSRVETMRVHQIVKGEHKKRGKTWN